MADMTSDLTSAPFLRYGPPPPASPPRSNVGGVVLTVLVMLISLPAALFTALLAAITYSGCFIGCSEASRDEVGGIALIALAAGILAAGPLTAAGAFRSRGWLVASGCVFGVGLLLGVTALTQS